MMMMMIIVMMMLSYDDEDDDDDDDAINTLWSILQTFWNAIAFEQNSHVANNVFFLYSNQHNS